ncbi:MULTISPECIES: TetR/AcrR family transcriptional regulator [unclassified Pseudoalteromonas]|uniref:TetR/AcrR family transcriptional regulator n=1 Tax=unclassified Pseudoalteromonas TaxID=194690 RepID=UPI0016023F8D|nr:MULTISPECIES: TetR/AcrR family transcriptional regulator [unclassified Pseudoalteromonas]MBB1332487.1 TetR/AcrR family transcriptional regulator [Pseudoalteromonas sp. SR41-6]MBB1343416.1 TetR/AcrR family transcriptional regulator [Pseudoalteromonas sp. SR45-6]MBB1434518.1 TetR/AcrR family transcriptional regulator [Pseudoalteromonas sp. SG43-6]MBB1457633.1 TetR/AcrR family transcriptional regulator [Pseudoalteromonas sp. SG41-8]
MNKKTQTYNKILTSAWLLFLEQGYAHTSTREIAKAANVAVGTVFSHFENKIDLLKAGMQQQIDTIIHQTSLTDRQHAPRLKLRHYALPLFEFYCNNIEFSKILISDMIWQAAFFEQQMSEFKKRLFNEQQEFDDIKASVMLDCYFMTIISGLNEPAPEPEKMLRQLTSKISIL